MDSNIKVLYRRCSVRLVVRRSPSLGVVSRLQKKKKGKIHEKMKNKRKKKKTQPGSSEKADSMTDELVRRS